MDINELQEGATLYLPVFVKGGLIWTGDSHCRQGNGEVNLTALVCVYREFVIPTVRRKDIKLELPRIRTADLLVRIGLDHEPWLWPVLRALADPRLQAGTAHYLDASRGVTLLQTETARVRSERDVHVHAFGNTHYWLDPENAKPITSAIVTSLAVLSPADRPVFDR